MQRPSTIDKYKKYMQNLPVWVKVTAGVVMVLVGLWLLTKPFYSLRLMVVMLAAALIIDGIGRLGRAGVSRLLGAPMVAGGLLMLAMPGISVWLISLIAGIGLLLGGLYDLVIAVKGTRKAGEAKGVKGARTATAIKGTAIMIFGALALIWRDMALLVLSVAFGANLIVVGILLIVRRGKNRQVKPQKPARTAKPAKDTLKRIANGAVAALMLVLALGLTFVGVRLHRSAPIPDEFYTWEGEIPEPGELLRYEKYTQAVPDGVRGWRILYSTTRDADGTPAVASAFVMAPEKEGGPQESEPQPIIAWAHGTTGVVPGCAPTVMDEPFPLDATVPAVEQAFSNGWAIVGADYVGLGTAGPHPYLIGQGEARSVLDSVRAAKRLAERLPELNLADETVVWGHSQGGHAALWTGGLAESYAPDVNVVGVAAAAPATELPTLLEGSQYLPVGKIMGSFAIRAYSETYPDVSFNEYVDPFLRPVVWEMSGRCLAESSTLLSLAATLAMPGTIYGKSPTTGAGGQRLIENIPNLPIAAKLLIAQGEADTLVLPEVQQGYVDRRRAAGQELTYKTYPGLGHLTLVDEGSPFNADLEEWTKSLLTTRQ